MDKCVARFALGLIIAGVLGCDSGGSADQGMDAAAGIDTSSGSVDAEQAGGGTPDGSSREAGQAGTGGAGAGGSTTSPPTGGAGAGGSTASRPVGGSASGGKTTTSTGASGGDAANQYIDAINAVRAAVSKPTNYSGSWAPLPDVVWSETVAASAQSWATHLATTQSCKLVHESQSTYGENLAMGTNLTPKQAVDMWASEKNLYTWSPTYSMADFNAGSGHYTQLAWRKSTQVGCGSATCSRNVVISCRFSPPGNSIGQAVY